MTASRPPLRDALGDYLSLRRALGFQLASAGRLLGQFVGYLEAHGIGHRHHRARAGLGHAACRGLGPLAGDPPVRGARLRRLPAQHSIPSAEVIPAGQFRPGGRAGPPRICIPMPRSRALIAAAATLRPRLRAATYQTLIGLLAVTGIRIGEAIGLDDEDFDTGRGLLVVRHAKYGKHRLVPLHPSAVRALARLCELRRPAHPRPASPALFVSTAGTRLLHSNIGLTFARLAEPGRAAPGARRPAGPGSMTSGILSRSLPCWAGTATAPTSPALMPRLSTYLGHTDPQHTFWYLSAAPELMALAGQRLERAPGR